MHKKHSFGVINFDMVIKNENIVVTFFYSFGSTQTYKTNQNISKLPRALMFPTIVSLADHIFSWQVVRYCNKIGCAFHCSLKF